MATVPAVQHLPGACPHDCPDTCAMIYEVEDGRLTRVRGNPAQPFTRGGLCVKLKDFAGRHYHPDRLLHPLRRTGPRGSGRYERIGWDQALNTIHARWSAIIDEHGAQAIMPYSYLGHQGVLQGLNVGDAFFNRLGATVCERTFCGEASCTAWLLTMGPSAGLDAESFLHSRYIVLWACNSVSTNLHHWHVIQQARKRGAKLVVIDAFRSRTAKMADWHIMPRPGTDGALAMALMHTLFAEDLVDRDYLERHTVGHAELAERARSRTPEWAAAITGVAADDIRRLAREYAGTRPAAIRIGVALERHHGGGQTIRAVSCLPALVGAWRDVGGGLLQMSMWDMPIRFDRIARPDFIPAGTRVVNALQVGRALTGELDLAPPLKSVMIFNANPLTQAPESARVRAGLAREDLFVIAADHFMTDSVAMADIVLPAAMAAEMEDVVMSWGHHYLTYNARAIAPPGEALPNTEIFRRLAARFGFDDEHFTRDDRAMLGEYLDWNSPALAGRTLDDLAAAGFVRVSTQSPDARVPHADGAFPTASGKCELLASGAANGNFVVEVFRQMYGGAQGGEQLDSLPDYVAPRESPASDPERAARYPLNILTPKSHAFLNSSYANGDGTKGPGAQPVLIHPADAAARGIAHGAPVRVYNDRGDFRAAATVTDDVPPGVVVAPFGRWAAGGGSVNAVSAAAFADMGHAPTFSDNLVEVEAASAGG